MHLTEKNTVYSRFSGAEHENKVILSRLNIKCKQLIEESNTTEVSRCAFYVNVLNAKFKVSELLVYNVNAIRWSMLNVWSTISIFSCVTKRSLFSMRLKAWTSSSFLRLRRLFLSRSGLYWLSASRRRFSCGLKNTYVDINVSRHIYMHYNSNLYINGLYNWAMVHFVNKDLDSI